MCGRDTIINKEEILLKQEKISLSSMRLKENRTLDGKRTMRYFIGVQSFYCLISEGRCSHDRFY